MRLLINPDGNIKSLIYLGDQVTNTKAYAESANHLMNDAAFYHMYQQRQGLQQITLNHLSTMPRGSFGNEVYEFYKKNNLDIYPMGRIEITTPAEYISERTRKIHDMLHVLLGYGTDLVGEAKVNAFVVAQTKSPISILILAGILVKILFKQPRQFLELVQGIDEGWREAGKYELFLTEDWDELLKYKTVEVRSLVAKQSIYRMVIPAM